MIFYSELFSNTTQQDIKLILNFVARFMTLITFSSLPFASDRTGDTGGGQHSQELLLLLLLNSCYHLNLLASPQEGDLGPQDSYKVDQSPPHLVCS